MRSILASITILVCSVSLHAQQAAEGPSPNQIISATIGGDYRTGSRVTIVYGRPYLKSPTTGAVRKAWGGELAPWGRAWRLGADEATLLMNQHPMVIGAVTIPPGAYTLYMIPMETGPSKLAFSRKIGGWGIPVDETADVARVDLVKSTLPTPVEQLTIAIDSVPPSSGVIKIMWESTQFALPFEIRR